MFDILNGKWCQHQIEKWYKTTEDNLEFIWGLKSDDDLTNNEASLYTMNDIDIIYDKKERTYRFGIETIYCFEKGLEGEKEYIQKLFNKFTEWMIQQNYNINRELNIYQVFTEGVNINTHFESIEDSYTTFKYMVKGFCG